MPINLNALIFNIIIVFLEGRDSFLIDDDKSLDVTKESERKDCLMLGLYRFLFMSAFYLNG